MKLGAKVKEKIARTIAGYFTTNQIVSVFEDANISTDVSLYAKWRITLDAFSKIPKPEEGLLPVLEEFCHPLCFSDLATREKFIQELNDTLSYENLVINFTEKTAKVVSLNDKSKEDSKPSISSKIELPEINNCTYSEKALELVASHLSNFISHSELRKMIIKVLGAKNALLNETSVKDYMDDFFDETPFYNFADVLQTIRKKDTDADKTISKLIASLLHPLNHNADEKMAEDLASQVAHYLKYDNFTVEKTDKGYVVLSQKERNEREQYLDAVVEEMQQEAPYEGDEDEILRQCDIATLTEAKDKIRKIRDSHQAYIDVIELFCRNTKKPTKDLNDAYLFLAKKIQKGLKDLKLQHYSISLYKPFKEDLYKAEMEWNGDEIRGFVNLGPSLSWDTIRPHLYAVHSEITNLCNLAEEDTDMTDDEKKLEEINNLISQERMKATTTHKGEIKKMEIFHKYEKKEKLSKPLSDCVVRFDDQTPAIFIDNQEVPLPEYGKEHYLARSLFNRKKNEAVDWSIVYNDMQSKKGVPDKEEWRYVYDAYNDINKRVQDILNTEEKLFSWSEKTIKRLH